jgi:serine/threonine-protein kinase HipA
MAERAVEVVVQIAGQDAHAGRLWSHRRRGTESGTFEYAPEYLGRPDAYPLDPRLPLLGGQHQTPIGHALFGAFSDCAPDGWGRRLIQRAERRRARREDATERSIREIDYLLGVRDDLRQGSLRFADPDSRAFLAAGKDGVPHLIELRSLLRAAERDERNEADDEELELLLHGGSSLGGARPKAHVIDLDGAVAIAKFPSPSRDGWDVIRWEAVALRLAREAGITVPPTRLETIDGRGVLILRRFDRSGRTRIGYISGMTMLEVVDGDDAGSYLDLAGAIEEHSPATTNDLEELWRRVAFSILITNTDDHLRNHGFLRRTTGGWSLSPAFDLNPDPRPGRRTLTTPIDYGRHEASLRSLFEAAPCFRLDETRARKIIGEVAKAVSSWRELALEHGLDQSAVEDMAPAFEHDETKTAHELAVEVV